MKIDINKPQMKMWLIALRM